MKQKEREKTVAGEGAAFGGGANSHGEDLDAEGRDHQIEGPAARGVHDQDHVAKRMVVNDQEGVGTAQAGGEVADSGAYSQGGGVQEAAHP